MIPVLSTLVSGVQRARRSTVGHCLVCRSPVLEGEDRIGVRGGGLVHRRCATYRMRQVDSLRVSGR